MSSTKSKTINTKNFISVLNLCEDNLLEIINKNNIKNWRSIKRPSINRVGLEIIGHFEIDDLNKNIIGFGTRESNLMDSVDVDQLENNLKRIFKQKPPLVICSNGVNQKNKDLIFKWANEFETPVVFVDTKLSFITTTVGIYIAEHFAPEDFVHGSLVIINGIGVLIVGPSGIGKSEAVIELIQRGHMFVSDDSVIIKRIGNHFIGQSPKITKNILEARGLGLIDIKTIYGEKSIKDKTNIDLVIELKKDDQYNFDRLGNENYFYNILDGKIKKILIPVRLGRNTASLIEVATSLFISKNEGVDTFKEIQERIRND
ncbi:HPr(Ser) kinase/phosphatase [Mesomycoplasma moatsii]|uniref:HPr(Ser) kinase/phosphatase n=1 Tax=Mesomycoplasma moatsii TaxID=171287 RepID=UPI0003B4998F